MLQPNDDLRQAAKEKSVFLWRVAHRMGVSLETLLSRWQRELSTEDKEEAMRIIDDLHNEGDGPYERCPRRISDHGPVEAKNDNDRNAIIKCLNSGGEVLFSFNGKKHFAFRHNNGMFEILDLANAKNGGRYDSAADLLRHHIGGEELADILQEITIHEMS